MNAAGPSGDSERLTDTQLARMAATVRGLVIDAVGTAGNGHAGAPLGLADVAAVLFWDVLRYDPTRPDWPARDRFILSNGHASALQYACLHLARLAVSLADLKRFRQLHSPTAGHPEFGACPGVEMTTGPLGQGFATAVGMALAQRLLAGRFPPDDTGFTPATGRVFVVCSDGDLMEGVASEALQLAGAWELGNLVAVYDCNGVTIDGRTEIAWVEDVRARFDANKWRTVAVPGHDVAALRTVLGDAAALADDPGNARPTLVIANTTIGYGSPTRAGSHTAHWGPLGPEELPRAKKTFGLDPDKTFDVPTALSELFDTRARAMTARAENWFGDLVRWREQNPVAARRWDAHFAPQPTGAERTRELIRAASDGTGAPCSIGALCGRVLNAIAAEDVRLVGGSADLAGSTSSTIRGVPYVRDESGTNFASGRNVHFGVREHAGAAIVNGLTLHGAFQGYLSSFLAFSDYCRPAIRLAALMRVPSIFYFTHDSVLLGPDGPTHQPVEHLWSLRLMPHVRLFRPADGAETAVAWQVAIDSRVPSGPVVIAATPKPLPPLERPADFDHAVIRRGGYVLSEDDRAQLTLCATGSEVPLAIEARDLLARRGVRARVASLPCLELFAEQPLDYRDRVLRPKRELPLVTIEAGATGPWYRYLTANDLAIGIDEFGASASWADVAPRFGLTAEQVVNRIVKHLDL